VQQGRLLAIVEDYDAAWSRFRPDSLVASAARASGRFEMPDSAAALGKLYQDLYRLSAGAMTPLIGGSLEHLGYDAAYSLKPKGSPVAPPRWEDVLKWDGSVLSTSSPVVLDVGAAGKGQVVDLLSADLLAQGFNEYFLDASGDLLNSGPKPVSIGLEHPYDPEQAIGTIDLGAGALCASASNRRTWGDGLHHVLDGLSGAPVQTTVATWTIAPTAMMGDALATALFLVPADRLEENFEFSWLKVFSDGSAEYSADFEGVLFS
jgi:thiamine biosynthesis lipoprotein